MDRHALYFNCRNDLPRAVTLTRDGDNAPLTRHPVWKVVTDSELQIKDSYQNIDDVLTMEDLQKSFGHIVEINRVNQQMRFDTFQIEGDETQKSNEFNILCIESQNIQK
jgi:hypothetical protein